MSSSRVGWVEKKSLAVLEALLSKLESPGDDVVRNFDERDAALESFADRLDGLGPALTPEQAKFMKSCCLVLQEQTLLPALLGQGQAIHSDTILDAVTTIGFPDEEKSKW